MNTAIDSSPTRARQRARELHPVFDLVVELVTLRGQRRMRWLDSQRTHAGPMGFDDPELEHRFYAGEESLAGVNQRIAALEQVLASGREYEHEHEHGAPLTALAGMFELDRAELDLLIGCLAAALEPTLAELYGRLQGHRERPYATEPLLARLFGWGRRRLWRAGSGLATWGLLRATEVGLGLPEALNIDPQVLAFLHGRYGLDSELLGCAALTPAIDPLPSWPVQALLERIRTSLAAGHALRVVVIGPEGSGRRSFAAAITQRLELGALAVDCDDVRDDEWAEIYLRTLRVTRMAGLVPVWHGERINRRWPRKGGAPLLQFVVCEDPRLLRPQVGVVDQHLVLPAPRIDERRALWQRLVPSSAAWPTPARERLASRHRLNVGDIAVVGRRLPTSADEAGLMAREQTRGRLGELGRLLDCAFDWDDLVVGARLRDALEDFAFEAKERGRFWESPQARRLFPRGTGLVALFTGPPGTGKTMAAQVLAADLELDLFRIDLASVVSKYIGETAKNLDKIFSRAGRMNAVLLFDEADALFSKRTEVKDSHDRHANTDTNYLLQLLEEYQGIALLASNKRNNIDPAFIRRIRYVLDFQRPDAGQRRAIWRRVLRELLDGEALRVLEPVIAGLAETVELSGAQIKNAVLAAVFIARRSGKPLQVDHLIRGIDRELNKEGRGINDREKLRLRRHG